MMSATATATVSHGRVLLPSHQQRRPISNRSEILRIREIVPRRCRLMMVTTTIANYKGTKMREEKLSEMIEEKVKEATEVCEADERSEECRVAWDEVEEVSQDRADLRIKLNKDPLESFCLENPETDECLIYED